MKAKLLMIINGRIKYFVFGEILNGEVLYGFQQTTYESLGDIKYYGDDLKLEFPSNQVIWKFRSDCRRDFK